MMNSDETPLDLVKKLSEHLDVDFALQTTGLGVWELDMKAGVISWDDRCRKLFGLANDNHLPYEKAIQYIHPDDVDRVNQAVNWAVNPVSGGEYDQTYRTIGADDGLLRWVHFYGRAYFSEDGELIRFGGVALDVTEQRQARERETAALEQSQRQQRILEAISASTPDLMYVFDLNYKFTYANQALLNMWGTDWETSIGKGLLDLGYEPWHAEMHEREIDEVVETKQQIRGQVSFPHATQGRRYYDYVFAPVFNDRGEVEAVAGTTRDITEIKLAQELERANELLSSSNDNLQNFAYVASHDLQEPLRKVQQFGNLLRARQTTFSADELDYIERMQSAANRMGILIQDLLDFSRLSSSRKPDERVSLHHVMEQVLTTLELTVTETGAKIDIGPLPEITGDASQLAQLFQNLIGNAVKFHKHGVKPVVRISSQLLDAAALPASVKPSQKARYYHRIDVADNGIGFDEKYLDRIFQVFQRLHGKNEFAGTGIGLAICQKVAANHGGAITAASTLGQGSVFTVFLPGSADANT